MADIMELARRRAAASQRVHHMGLSNVPEKLEDQVASNARYRLAYDAFARADRDYQDAISKLSTEELTTLSYAGP